LCALFLNYFSDLPILDISQSRDFSVNIRGRTDLKSLARGWPLTFPVRGQFRPELIGYVMENGICLRQHQNWQAISIIRGRITEQ
jgi:hypothetical protein